MSAGRAALPASRARGDAPALLAALVTVGLWGSAFVAIRHAATTFSPGALALGRLLVAVALLGIPVAVRRARLPRRPDLLRIAAFGLLFLAGYSVALNAAERRVDAGTAAMVVNVGPLLIALLAGLLLGEGFPPRLLAGCGVAVAGVAAIGAGSSGPTSRSGFGIALLAVAAVAYATAVVVQKPAMARVDALEATWLGCAVAAAACLPFAPALVDQLGHAGAAGGWIVYLGAGPTALGFVTYAFALRRMPAGSLATLGYLIPVVAILLGWALLGERPAPLALAGGALCVAGVWLARRR